MKPIIPAILTDNFSDFQQKLKKVESLSSWLQIDVSDGRFTPNKTLSLNDLLPLKFKQNLELHLMVFEPEKYFLTAEKLKVKRVIVHYEAVEKNIDEIFSKKYPFNLGLALNPTTSEEKIFPYLSKVNFILILGVTPGAQGQKFQEPVLEKIKKIKTFSPKTIIEVDGGINETTIQKVNQAGADIFVVGSAILKTKEPKKMIENLKNLISL
jgi:Pentose-5-phosphate-3-epimerase